MEKWICNPLDLEYRYQYRTSLVGGHTVVILEHIGIPEVEGAGEGLERLCQRIGAGVEGAGLSPPGGAEHRL